MLPPSPFFLFGGKKNRDRKGAENSGPALHIRSRLIFFLLCFSSFSVVLLRACWMQATDKCEVDGEASVCTCTQDLCNGAPPTGRPPGLSLQTPGGGYSGLFALARTIAVAAVARWTLT